MKEFKSSIKIVSRYTDQIKQEWDVTISEHSDGAIKVSMPHGVRQVTDIIAHIKCPLGVQALFTVMYNLCNNGSVTVTIPYYPYARQDRITNEGESQVLKTRDAFSYTLNSMLESSGSFKNWKVVYEDLHSTLMEGLSFRKVEVPQHVALLHHLPLDTFDFIVAADKGAREKLEKLTRTKSGKVIKQVQFQKERKEDGTITHFLQASGVSKKDLEGSSVLIPDDIIDYGGTITGLAKLLKEEYGVKHVTTYHTHGILPTNKRLETPSRFSSVLEYVDLMYLNYIWTTEEDPNLTEKPSNVIYFNKF